MENKNTINDDLKKKIIEAFIFASKKPVHISLLQDFENDKNNLENLIKELQEKYINSGIHLIKIDQSFVFRTSDEVSGLLNIEQELTKPLSRAASEILAIIAYHQPVTRSQIENIRGVTLSKGTIDLLFEVGWVKPGKRLKTPGRPLTWITTTSFLDHFGLSSLTDLPGLEELKLSGLLSHENILFSDPTNDEE